MKHFKVLLLLLISTFTLTGCNLRHDLPPDYALQVCLRHVHEIYPYPNRSVRTMRLYTMAEKGCYKQQEYCNNGNIEKCKRFKDRYISGQY